MGESHVELDAQWRGLVGSSAEALAAGSSLVARWREPHRAYHTVTHLAAVLDRLDELGGEGVAVDPAVRLAAWFHDAVYDPRARDNEAASAALAIDVLGRLGFDERTVAEVARLVQLTARHRPAPADAAGAALCDADLAVLAGPPEEYRAYAAAVRREFRHLSDSGFRRGRHAVVADLLGRPRLFATAAGRRRWEAPARANLVAELATLILEAGEV